jgi:D-3-phosphoglycerate dehydrogenase / 2-oxoglutarate reductase
LGRVDGQAAFCYIGWAMAFKVYMTDGGLADGDIERSVLDAVGAELVMVPYSSEREVADNLADADALLVIYAHVGALAFSHLPRLKAAVRTGIGLDPIDLAAATAHGVCVANVPDYCVPEVSDHSLALILACGRKVAQLDRAVHSGTWDAAATARPLVRLEGQTVGIVGFGRIGQRLARLCRGVGFTVVAYDPYVSAELANQAGAELVTLPTLLAVADYVSVNSPLTPETRHLLGRAQFAQMKATAYIINTSRGAVLDEAALISVLREGRIAGAALDVLEREPPDPTNPLLEMPNVILTPHAAFYSEQAYRELRFRSASEVARVLSGRYPRVLANPAVKARLKELGRELIED